MTVKELIELLENAPQDMEVYIPMGEQFDGYFRSPCAGETGVSELGLNEHTNETAPAFIIAPHDFFSEELEEDIIPELN